MASLTSCFNGPHFNLIPTFCDWEEHNGGYGIPSYTHKSTGRVYGNVVRQSDSGMRKKFLLLFFAQPLIVGLLRMPYRIFRLITGDFVKTGKQFARNEWLLVKQAWVNQMEAAMKNGTALPAEPTKLQYRKIVVKHVALEFATNLLKLVTYPLALVGMELSSIYGLLNPIDGRLIYSFFERTWRTNFEVNKMSDNFFVRNGEFTAVCMQPKDVWEDLNLYRYLHTYNPERLRTHFYNLRHKMKLRNSFYQGAGLDVNYIMTRWQEYRREVEGRGAALDAKNAIEKALEMIENSYLEYSPKNAESFRQQVEKAKTTIEDSMAKLGELSELPPVEAVTADF